MKLKNRFKNRYALKPMPSGHLYRHDYDLDWFKCVVMPKARQTKTKDNLFNHLNTLLKYETL